MTLEFVKTLDEDTLQNTVEDTLQKVLKILYKTLDEDTLQNSVEDSSWLMA